MSDDIKLGSLPDLNPVEILSTEHGKSEVVSGSPVHSSNAVEKQNDVLHKQLADEYEDRTQDQKLRHTEEEHDLRKSHLDFLKRVTVYWLALITVLSAFQGFGGLIPFSIKFVTIKEETLPFILIFKKFQLSDTSFIALITTTTATILGLYTIAAIWLYKGKQEDEKQKNGKQSEEKPQNSDK